MNNLDSYIDLTGNESLLNLKGKDLLYIIKLINNYDLVLRDEIGIDKNYSLGLEIEFEFEFVKKFNQLKDFLEEKYQGWEIKPDESLRNGAEITTPVFYDNMASWKSIDVVCKELQNGVNVGVKSGGHVHIGANTLGDNLEYWKNFLKLWQTYENIIYRFCYNDFLGPRPSISKFAYPISLKIDDVFKKMSFTNLEELIKLLNEDKFQGVNFRHIDITNINQENYLNTIEFRCPNGTVDSVIWQNNVNLFTKIMEYCKSRNFNEDIINRRYLVNTSVNGYGNLDYYGLINLEQSLEFCDLIFDNNLDKIYFLKQYLKYMRECNKQSYILGKKLTK